MKRMVTKYVFFIAIFTLSGTVCLAQTKKRTVKPAPKTASSEILQGKGLISKSDCLTCHKLDVKLVGPAYKDVAKKYAPTPANYTLLANKVIKGGSGVWGQIPMVPHPTLAVTDVKKMIKYILSIKG